MVVGCDCIHVSVTDILPVLCVGCNAFVLWFDGFVVYDVLFLSEQFRSNIALRYLVCFFVVYVIWCWFEFMSLCVCVCLRVCAGAVRCSHQSIGSWYLFHL